MLRMPKNHCTIQSLIKVHVHFKVTLDFLGCTMLIGDCTHMCISEFPRVYYYWRLYEHRYLWIFPECTHTGSVECTHKLQMELSNTLV